jgi:hypothetical protein
MMISVSRSQAKISRKRATRNGEEIWPAPSSGVKQAEIAESRFHISRQLYAAQTLLRVPGRRILAEMKAGGLPTGGYFVPADMGQKKLAAGLNDFHFLL